MSNRGEKTHWDADNKRHNEKLEKGGDEIKSAIFNPPETTRAFFRGRAVARFNDQISSIQWDEIVFANPAAAGHSYRVALPEAAINARLDALNHAARNGKDFSEFMSAVLRID